MTGLAYGMKGQPWCEGQSGAHCSASVVLRNIADYKYNLVINKSCKLSQKVTIIPNHL